MKCHPPNCFNMDYYIHGLNFLIVEPWDLYFGRTCMHNRGDWISVTSIMSLCSCSPCIIPCIRNLKFPFSLSCGQSVVVAPGMSSFYVCWSVRTVTVLQLFNRWRYLEVWSISEALSLQYQCYISQKNELWVEKTFHFSDTASRKDELFWHLQTPSHG